MVIYKGLNLYIFQMYKHWDFMKLKDQISSMPWPWKAQYNLQPYKEITSERDS